MNKRQSKKMYKKHYSLRPHKKNRRPVDPEKVREFLALVEELKRGFRPLQWLKEGE